jgi:hypothetical protein
LLPSFLGYGLTIGISFPVVLPAYDRFYGSQSWKKSCYPTDQASASCTTLEEETPPPLKPEPAQVRKDHHSIDTIVLEGEKQRQFVNNSLLLAC